MRSSRMGIFLTIAIAFMPTLAARAQEQTLPPPATEGQGSALAPNQTPETIPMPAEPPMWGTPGVESGCASSCAPQPVQPGGCFDACGCGRRWHVRVVPYAWVPGIHGDVRVRNVTAPVDVTIGKTLDILLHDINMAALGQIEADNGTFGVIVNGVYVNVSPGRTVDNVSFGTDLQMTIIDAVGTWQLPCVADAIGLPRGSKLEALAGFRYIGLSSGITATDTAGNSASANGEATWFDPIFGGRVRVPVFNCWTAQVRGDIGGFGLGDASQFTWNVEATLEYRMSSRCSMFAGYRWLDINYARGPFGIDTNLNGPMAGFALDF